MPLNIVGNQTKPIYLVIKQKQGFGLGGVGPYSKNNSVPCPRALLPALIPEMYKCIHAKQYVLLVKGEVL